MKWNISVIRRKETNKYFESTGEGNWIRPRIIFNFFQKIFEYITKKGISPVWKEWMLFMSKMLNVYLYLNIASPLAKPKYVLSNR